MADLITRADFEARTGRTLSASEVVQVDALIVDASALVRDLADDELVTVPASIIPVVVNMVRRGLDNPHGFSSESAEGGYRYAGAATEGIFATRQEARTIRRAVGTGAVSELNLEVPFGPWPPAYGLSWLDGAL